MLGDVIKNRRSAKGWTQGAFAKKLAVSIGYISEIETGRRMPSLNMLLSMIDLLECTPNEILEYNGREEQDVKEKAEPYLCSSGTDETIASTVRMMLTMTPEERFKVFTYAKDQIFRIISEAAESGAASSNGAEAARILGPGAERTKKGEPFGSPIFLFSRRVTSLRGSGP